MRREAVAWAINLAYYAATIIGAFTLSGLFNGIAGSSLTAKLRSKGMQSLMRQEMGTRTQRL